MLTSLVLALALAAGDGNTLIRIQAGRLIPANRRPVMSAAAFLHFPFDKTGPLIEDDAGTICHHWWTSAGIQTSTPACTWTDRYATNNGGTPNPHTVTPFYLDGFAAAPLHSVVFGGTNATYFWRTATIPQTHSVCIRYALGTLATYESTPLRTGGPEIGNSSGSTLYDRRSTDAGVASVALPGLNAGSGAWNVVCYGRTTTAFAGKANFGAYTSAATTAPAPGSISWLIGAQVGSYYYAGQVAEVWITSTAPSDALFTTVMNRVWGQQSRQTLTGTVTASFTRAGSASYQIPTSSVLFVPTNVPRVNAEGLITEGATTNYFYESSRMDNAAFWLTISNSTTTRVAGADGANSAANTIAWKGTGDSRVLQDLQAGYGNAARTCSVHVKAAGTGTLATHVQIAVSDRAADTNQVSAIWPITSSWTRIHVTAPGLRGRCWFRSVSAAGTPNTSVFTAWGAQFEPGDGPSSYIVTTGTIASRSADSLGIPNPLTNEPVWCIDVTATPRGAWTATPAVFSTGTDASANSYRLRVSDTDLVWDTYDTAAAQRVGTTPHGFATGTQHWLAAGANTGTLALFTDGTQRSLNVTGVGTGVIASHQSPLKMGISSGPNTSWTGTMKNLRLFNADCAQVRTP
jgi:hypothetical protein